MNNVDNPQNTETWTQPVTDVVGLPVFIAKSVRQAILTGKLSAGQKINEEELAKAFATSRTPVREALRLLEGEGLISVLSRRGAWVSPLLPEDAADTYICRAHFYGLAARLSAFRRQDHDIALLQRLMDELDIAVGEGDPVHYLDVMGRLNTAIVATSGNPHIATALRPLDLKAVRFRHISILLPDRLPRSRDNYRKIVSAIEAVEPDAAERAARHAIAEAGEALLAHLVPDGSLTITGVFDTP